jgi:hypothetical protein
MVGSSFLCINIYNRVTCLRIYAETESRKIKDLKTFINVLVYINSKH